jgi:Transposase DDE domain group 1
MVSADGRGMVSQAGAVLWGTMRVTGLGRGLSTGLDRWRAPRAVHDPGKIVADLAAAVALGGDCLADIAVLREQPELAGPVASSTSGTRNIEASQFGSGGHYKRAPRRPLLEVGHRMVGEIRLQHVSHCFRVEHLAVRDQRTQLGGGGSLTTAKGPIEPDDRVVMVRAHSPSWVPLRARPVGSGVLGVHQHWAGRRPAGPGRRCLLR